MHIFLYIRRYTCSFYKIIPPRIYIIIKVTYLTQKDLEK